MDESSLTLGSVTPVQNGGSVPFCNKQECKKCEQWGKRIAALEAQIQGQLSEEKKEWLKSIGAVSLFDYPYTVWHGDKRIMGFSTKYINETPLNELVESFKKHLEHLGKCNEVTQG